MFVWPFYFISMFNIVAKMFYSKYEKFYFVLSYFMSLYFLYFINCINPNKSINTIAITIAALDPVFGNTLLLKYCFR